MYTETLPFPFASSQSYKHPYLLVNIGSGVSMIKISGPRQFERVGGTSLGGGTLFGLLSLLTGERNFENMLALAEKGDNTKVDMLVGDIYGTDYNKIGLKSTTIASTMGKIYRTKRQAEREAEDHGGMNLHYHDNESNGDKQSPSESAGASSHISFLPEDLSRSLLYAISNNIGQLAYLHAEKHGCENIYFGGSFIGGHYQTMATLAYAIKFWSKGSKVAYFLRHEGYLGAVGAFLNRHVTAESISSRRGSFDGLVASLSRVTSRT
jgi:type II pantothenate kinase